MVTNSFATRIGTLRSRTSSHLENRCSRCFLRKDLCICRSVQPIDTSVRILIIRHAQEAWKTTNTARLALLALSKAQCIDYGAKGKPFVADRIPQQSWLAFPREHPSIPTGGPPHSVVFLDGTWVQAKRMVQRIPALAKMPRVSLGVRKTSSIRLRTAPKPSALSTFEAIAYVVELFEGVEKVRPLHVLYEEVVRRTLVTRGRLSENQAIFSAD